MQICKKTNSFVCDCVNNSTYKSVTGNLCCNKCFLPVNVLVEKRVRITHCICIDSVEDRFEVALYVYEDNKQVSRNVLCAYNRFSDDYALSKANKQASMLKNDYPAEYTEIVMRMKYDIYN